MKKQYEMVIEFLHPWMSKEATEVHQRCSDPQENHPSEKEIKEFAQEIRLQFTFGRDERLYYPILKKVWVREIYTDILEDEKL